jgi:hypothetical protein
MGTEVMKMSPSPNNPEFVALSREAGIAAELLASGVTALGKAHAAQDGWYNLAFFNLSIGFERTAKLAIVVNHCLDHSGTFPSDDELKKKYGHDIKALLEHVNQISQQRRPGMEYGILPSTGIHQGIIETLSEFAKVTRYYNLDLLVTGKGRAYGDPLAAWMARVGSPILAKHYSVRRRGADKRGAGVLEQMMGDITLVRNLSESGAPINSIEEAALHSAQTTVVQKYGQLYTLQIIRFLAFLMFELTHEAYRSPATVIPHLSEFFGMFMNKDAYFKGRRTWSLYRQERVPMQAFPNYTVFGIVRCGLSGRGSQ